MVATRWLLACMAAAHMSTLEATQFQPNISTTFEPLNDRFFVQYLDNAYLSGFVAQDYIQLGRYTAMTRFGCVTESKGHNWWNADGILGLGLPGTALPQVPNPLLYALSDQKQTKQKELEKHVHIMDHRIFTLVLGSGDGELQLGGYDEKSVEGTMVEANVIGDKVSGKEEQFLHYQIKVDGVRLGKHPLVHFRKRLNESLLNETKGADSAKPIDESVMAVLDSGTSCLVLPDSTFGGRLVQSPYRIFKQLWVNLDNPSLFFKIGGQELEMTYSQYMVDGRACVMRMKNAPETFLLGGIFFQHMVVVHDLQNTSQPKVLIGRRNENYQLGGDMPIESGTVAQNEMGSAQIRRPNSVIRDERGRKKQVSKVPVHAFNQFVYFVEMDVGTPAQGKIRVILDTGSSVFALFNKPITLRMDTLATITWILMGLVAVLAILLMFLTFTQKPPPERADGDPREANVLAGGGF